MYKVMIDKFEGPLDLLLHLIKQANIDIYEIKIEEITKQYLDYIKAMEELNLNIASEYLVMAAELIELKAKSLLPKEEIEADDYEKETLIERLIQYKKYKEMTDDFRELEALRKKIITKECLDLNICQNNKIEMNEDINLDMLLGALKSVLVRKEKLKPLSTKIYKKEISIEQISFDLKQRLKKEKKVNFIDLFESFNKEYIIVTFLAVLNLAYKKEIDIKQEDNYDKIYLMLRGVELE